MPRRPASPLGLLALLLAFGPLGAREARAGLLHAGSVRRSRHIVHGCGSPAGSSGCTIAA